MIFKLLKVKNLFFNATLNFPVFEAGQLFRTPVDESFGVLLPETARQYWFFLKSYRLETRLKYIQTDKNAPNHPSNPDSRTTKRD